VAATIVLMLVLLPHALEDFHYGDLLRLGISLPVGIAIFVGAYALEITGIALTARGYRGGSELLGVMGAVWCIGAIAIHGHDLIFAGAEYRHGLISKLLEVAVIVLGAACAVLAVLSLRFANTRRAAPR
jgi:hypothetical protein